MKITRDNINEIPEREQVLLKALFDDLDEINKTSKFPISIYWQDYHDDYEMYPDYYGCYRLVIEDINETIGLEMDIEDLDVTLCGICNFIEYCL